MKMIEGLIWFPRGEASKKDDEWAFEELNHWMYSVCCNRVLATAVMATDYGRGFSIRSATLRQRGYCEYLFSCCNKRVCDQFSRWCFFMLRIMFISGGCKISKT
ncbi:hypothetical protein Hdeb2414_s0006g00221261 [Helianthus debilis subsp. tardiflorus]